jgi:hypothetical protein
MRRVSLLLSLLALAVGCRTTIAPVRKEPPHMTYVGDKSCSVYDYAAAHDLPDGSKNLGWVQVKRIASDDDATFVALRQKICEMGGDALSQAGWVHDEGDYEPTLLKANAWVLP